jgi:hypothetical protein
VICGFDQRGGVVELELEVLVRDVSVPVRLRDDPFVEELLPEEPFVEESFVVERLVDAPLLDVGAVWPVADVPPVGAPLFAPVPIEPLLVVLVVDESLEDAPLCRR